jgi:hypothetical protein
LIRQAISCDICASEKKQTNHWFVAHEQGGELRLTGWNSRNRLRPGSKHLCGQTCLHKLVDEFMARAIAVRGQSAMAEEAVAHPPAAADMRKVPPVAFEAPPPLELESSSRMLTHAEPLAPKRVPPRLPAEVVPLPGRLTSDDSVIPDEAPRYASRNWRAEAWDRERERELRAIERRPSISPRRRSGS